MDEWFEGQPACPQAAFFLEAGGKLQPTIDRLRCTKKLDDWHLGKIAGKDPSQGILVATAPLHSFPNDPDIFTSDIGDWFVTRGNELLDNLHLLLPPT